MSSTAADAPAASAAVVIDVGSGTTRAGFAGEDAPRLVLPTVVTRKRHVWPVQRGVVEDWGALEALLDQLFASEELGPVDALEETHVVYAVPPSMGMAARSKLADIFFTKLRVSSLALVNSAVMALFATGRVTGLCVDCGHGVTHTVPVFSGFALPHAVRQLRVGGHDVTQRLEQLLLNKGQASANALHPVVRDIKEKLARVVSPEMKRQARRVVEYELPDGSLLPVDTATCDAAVEVLFDASQRSGGDEGAQGQTLQEMAVESLACLDQGVREQCLANVVATGGTSMMRGFGSRLRHELNAELGKADAVHVVQDSQRLHGAWTGASMYASLELFSEELRITKKEFLDDEDIVHKKYF